jgi:hypothetical protein
VGKAVIIDALNLLGALCGFLGAYYWYQSSRVQYFPDWNKTSQEPVDRDLRQLEINTASSKGMGEASRLNKAAALWTGAALGFGAISVGANLLIKYIH